MLMVQAASEEDEGKEGLMEAGIFAALEESVIPRIAIPGNYTVHAECGMWHVLKRRSGTLVTSGPCHQFTMFSPSTRTVCLL